MNRTRIHRPFLRKVMLFMDKKITPLNYYDYNKKDRRVFEFIEKWGLSKKNGKVYHKGLQVIPYEDTEDILKKEAMSGGMPLSRDGAFAYLKRKYIGFKKNKIMAWLKRVESLQLTKRRTEVPRSKPARAREGATNWRMAAFNEGKYNLGVDLFDIPRQWSKYKHFFVAVLQKTGYTWALPLYKKDASINLVALKQVFKDCKARFGSEPTAVTSDKGGEFKNKKWASWLGGRRCKQKFEKKLCSWVEKKNSLFGRTFAVMLNVHRPRGKKTGGFKKALELTLEKINNTVSRKTRKAPADWTPEDFTKKLKRYNRKIKAVPKRKVHKGFPDGARVRQMLKAAVDKGGFYKSYEGMRDKQHSMWSHKIFKVTDRKHYGKGFGYRYKISNPEDNDWIPQRELQLIPDAKVIKLRLDRPPPMAKKKPKKPGKMVRGFPPKPKAKAKSVVPLRRSSRVRKAPVRFGYS